MPSPTTAAAPRFLRTETKSTSVRPTLPVLRSHLSFFKRISSSWKVLASDCLTTTIRLPTRVSLSDYFAGPAQPMQVFVRRWFTTTVRLRISLRQDFPSTVFLIVHVSHTRLFLFAIFTRWPSPIIIGDQSSQLLTRLFFSRFETRRKLLFPYNHSSVVPPHWPQCSTVSVVGHWKLHETQTKYIR